MRPTFVSTCYAILKAEISNSQKLRPVCCFVYDVCPTDESLLGMLDDEVLEAAHTPRSSAPIL